MGGGGGIINRSLLQEIEEWKYDNPTDKQDFSNIKILISYHKPAFLFQHRALLPMFAGTEVAKQRATSGGNIVNNSDLSIEWLNKLQSDNEGDNISYINRICSLSTVFYWAWKHYEQIGNPAYIGSFHYRKLFSFDVLGTYLNYDMILPPKRITNYLCDFFIVFGTDAVKVYNIVIDCINNIHPNLVERIDKYFKLTKKYIYYDEMFVLKKHLFFEYCEFIFPIIFELEKRLDDLPKTTTFGDVRVLSWIVERLLGWWLYEKTADYKYLETKIIYSC